MKYRFTQPLTMPRGTHYGNNYWIFFSRKLNRRVTAFSNLEYENLLTLEMCSDVEYYCEQPLKTTVMLDGKQSDTIFDVWVLYKDGHEELQEVKYRSELEEDSDKGKRSREQITKQKMWCLQNNINYELRTDEKIELGDFYIRNLSTLATRARRYNLEDPVVDKAITQYLESLGTTTIGYLTSSGRFTNKTLDILADFYYRGIISFNNIENEPINNRMEVVFNGM